MTRLQQLLSQLPVDGPSVAELLTRIRLQTQQAHGQPAPIKHTQIKQIQINHTQIKTSQLQQGGHQAKPLPNGPRHKGGYPKDWYHKTRQIL